jgi:hypothetical protein
MIAHMFGPVSGNRHDCFLLQASNLVTYLRTHALKEDGQPYVIYGDPAYSSSHAIHVQGPFKGSRLSREQEDYNRRMSAVRQCVEWEFGRLVRLWAFLDFVKQQKVYLQNVGKLYLVAAIMANVHGCMYPSQTAQYFGVQPPTVDEYLHPNIVGHQ